MLCGFRKHKKKWIGFLTVVVGLIGFRLYLPTLAKNYINKQLNQDPLYRGHVETVHIHLWRGAYTIVGLDIRRVEGQKEFPLVSVDTIDIGVSWHELMRRQVRAKLVLKDLVINIVQENADGGKKISVGRDTKEGKKEEAQDWKGTFKNLVPIDVGRLLIQGKSIHYRDLTSNPKLDIFMDQLQIRGENLTNSEKASKSLFGTIDMRGRVMNSGMLHVVLYIDPLKSPPEFKATTQMDGLELIRLNDFFEAYASFNVKGGTLGVYSEMATADGNIKGYVKPIMKDLKVADLKKDLKKGGIFHAAWEVLVGAVGGIVKNHQRNQQAARITFEGRLDNPKTSTWDTIKSIFYNMLIKPISPKIEKSVKMSDVKAK